MFYFSPCFAWMIIIFELMMKITTQKAKFNRAETKHKLMDKTKNNKHKTHVDNDLALNNTWLRK